MGYQYHRKNMEKYEKVENAKMASISFSFFFFPEAVVGYSPMER